MLKLSQGDRSRSLCCRVQTSPPAKPLQCTKHYCDIAKGLCTSEPDESNIESRSVILDDESANLVGRNEKKISFYLVGMAAFPHILRTCPSRGQLFRTLARRVQVSHLYHWLQRGPCPASSVQTTEMAMSILDKSKGPDKKNYTNIPQEM